MEQLIQFIHHFVSPNKKELSSFLGAFKIVQIPKGKLIQKRDFKCNTIYFLEEGFVKYSLEIKGKDVVVSLASNGALVSDYYGFYTEELALSDIRAITNCTLYAITREDLEEQYNKYKIWERFGRLVAQGGLLEQIMEKLDFQTKTPQELYIQMLRNNKELFNIVSLGDIAGSLGITQESLSRIRARI